MKTQDEMMMISLAGKPKAFANAWLAAARWDNSNEIRYPLEFDFILLTHKSQSIIITSSSIAMSQ